MPGQNYYTAAQEHLAVETIGDELLIYDRRSDVAHCLGEVAARVWSRCQGGASLDELVIAVAPLTDAADAEALVLTALAELQDKELLAITGDSSAAVSRRDVLKRLAAVGAAATVAPLVVSAAVPKPADAAGSNATSCHTASTTNTSCTVASSSPLVFNGCCSPTQVAPGYFCSSTKHCVACVGPGVKPGGTDCSKNSLGFMCCTGVCTGATC